MESEPQEYQSVLSSDQKLLFSAHEKEKLRIIGQELKYMGLSSTLIELTKEADVVLEHPVVTDLETCIIDARWDDAYDSTKVLSNFVDNGIVEQIQYLIIKRKFYEYLENHNFEDAFYCMRQDLIKSASVDILDISKLLVSVGIAKGEQDPSITKKMRETLVADINDMLPNDVIVPPQRLRKLLQQANEMQARRCPYHNKEIRMDILESCDLFTDHVCPIEMLPINNIKTLDFSDEVLSVKFSHDGCYLAVGTKDSNLVIFSVNNETFQFTRKHLIECSTTNDAPISSLAWHPKGHYLVCAISSPAKYVILVDTTNASCKRITFTSQVQHISWDMVNSEQFLAGGNGGCLILSKISGEVVFAHQGYRAVGLHCLRSGKVLIADSHRRIVLSNLTTVNFEVLFQEDKHIVGMELDSKEEYIVLTLHNSTINVWEFKTRAKLYTYIGAVNSEYIIRSSMGGFGESFIASGSEDGNVYIWNHAKSRKIFTLSGHTKMVNSVHWNPVNPKMLVSCSDDEKLILWGPVFISTTL